MEFTLGRIKYIYLIYIAFHLNIIKLFLPIFPLL